MKKIVKFNTSKSSCWFCGKEGKITRIEFIRFPVGYYPIPACDECLKKLQEEFAKLNV